MDSGYDDWGSAVEVDNNGSRLLAKLLERPPPGEA